MSVRWVITCEHGGNAIPGAFASIFYDAEAQHALNSHRGWDPGALELFKILEPLADYSNAVTVSRLLVELNRSLHHPKLFSKFTKGLQEQERALIIDKYYTPYRKNVEAAIKQFIGDGHQVYHLSIHSFTPVLEGQVRNADIGLLYDPSRLQERELCNHWKNIFLRLIPEVRIRFNYPYKGTADGFTTYLRKQFPADYAGIEFELNQEWANDQQAYNIIYSSVKELKQLNE
ncbi:N-formylglutamate amidohydrolase [Cesiribacter sp. SM1]|uniref:N-formylglutamate amidohydrolase n=1 Tax=Cesiribacter sp. SM1 TaxID=2861196 RepID=UPI001CD5CCAB|nr:N-formylglutamate amidohydrolase [Cesiribacter sp. SM1]